jgi:hypothetical protein
MDRIDRVSAALRDALIAYAKLDQASMPRVVVSLFGITQSKRLAPMLDELARHVQPMREGARHDR